MFSREFIISLVRLPDRCVVTPLDNQSFLVSDIFDNPKIVRIAEDELVVELKIKRSRKTRRLPRPQQRVIRFGDPDFYAKLNQSLGRWT